MKMAVDTAVTVPVNVCPLLDDTDFKTRETAVAYNAAGLDLVWNFVTPAGVQTQTAVTPTNTGGSYDWVNVGDGMYNIEIPASGGASINNDTEGYGWFSGVATGVLPWVGPIIEFVPAHVVNGLVTGSDKLQVDVIEVNSVSLATDGPVPHLGIVDQGTAQSASSTGVVLRSAAAFTDDTLIGCTIGVYGSTQGYWQFRQITDNALSGDTVTVDAWTVTPSGTITYKIFGGAPASATFPPAVNVTQWKGATAPDNTGDSYAVVNSGTFGNSALKTLIDAIDDYIDTEVAAIKAKTDNLPADPADASDIAASFAAVSSTLSTIASYIDTEVAAIKAKTDNLPADPADASDIAASFGTVNSTLSTIASYIDTEVAAIKAKTDQLTFTVSNVLDTNMTYIDGANTVDGLSLDIVLQRIHSFLWAKKSGLVAGVGTMTVRNLADTTNLGTITVSTDGNVTGVS